MAMGTVVVNTTHLGFLEVTPFLSVGDCEALELVVRRHGVDYLIDDVSYLFTFTILSISCCIIVRNDYTPSIDRL